MTVQISFKRNKGVFHTGPWFWPFVSSKTYPYLFGILSNLGTSSNFCLGVRWYCVCCLSCASWKSCCDIHYFCCRHLWRWWSLFSKYRKRSRIILHNVTSEYNSTFVFLKLRLQLRLLEMTEIHSWRKMYCSAFIPCFSDHLIFASDFRQLPCRDFLEFFPLFSTAAFASGTFIAWGIGINLCTRLQRLNEFKPFPAMWSSWYLREAPSIRILIDSSASTMHAYFVLRPQMGRQVSLLLRHNEVLQGIVAGIGMSDFPRAFFMISLSSSSPGWNEVNVT